MIIESFVKTAMKAEKQTRMEVKLICIIEAGS